MYSPSGHPERKWVCLLIRADLEKFSIASVAHQSMLCSEWVPSEWESKQLIKTSTRQVIHTTQSIMLHLVKQKAVFKLDNLKNKLPIYIAFSSEKKL